MDSRIRTAGLASLTAFRAESAQFSATVDGMLNHGVTAGHPGRPR